MGNMPGPEYKNGKPTRLLLSLQAWGASSKADAKKKVEEAERKAKKEIDAANAKIKEAEQEAEEAQKES